MIIYSTHDLIRIKVKLQLSEFVTTFNGLRIIFINGLPYNATTHWCNQLVRYHNEKYYGVCYRMLYQLTRDPSYNKVA